MTEKPKEAEALLSSSNSSSEDSETESEKDKSTKETNEQQKISGKAWGVLQFRKLRQFPFSVFFIVGNEFCERFSYYGMRAVLVLYLHNQLDFGEDSATAIYHGFIMLCYLLPLLGAIISDSCLGKYGTILSLSIVYAIGNILVSVSAIPIVSGVNIALAMVGLVVIAVGTGGIKPCVSALGGDQFKENQQDLLRRFFSLFYFSINAGSVISTLLTPVLRSQVQCLGTENCFALAFGVPAALMIISLFVFVAGTRYYIIKKPKKDAALLFLNVPNCIGTAVFRRLKHGKVPGMKNILHYASPKFSDTFIEDVWLVLRVLVMFLPLPIFWALFDQQGSRWTLQAVRMNGQLGKVTIQPDQVQALNPILILVFIPIFETIVYPIFAKCHLLKKPLQRMVAGMVLGGLAFMVAGFVQLKVQGADDSLGAGEAKVIFTNGIQDPGYLLFQYEEEASFNLSYGQSRVFREEQLGDNFNLNISGGGISESFPFELNSKSITHVVVSEDEDGTVAFGKSIYEEFSPEGGKASVQVINAVNRGVLSFSLCSKYDCGKREFDVPDLGFLNISCHDNLTVGSYFYQIEANLSSVLAANDSDIVMQKGKLDGKLQGGAIYTIVLMEDGGSGNYTVTFVEIDPPNSVSLFLQVPMYVLITAGEVMFSITGLEFAYSQAPASMKALCQAAWLWTVAFGNLVVIIIAESSLFANQAIEFFFFAICIVALAILFAIMSYFYKYVDLSNRGVEQSGNLNAQDHSETSALVLGKNSPEEEKRTNYTLEKEDDVQPSESEL